jgi:hypothetical protein
MNSKGVERVGLAAWSPEAVAALARLEAVNAELLDRRNAFDCVDGQNFVGYLRRTADGVELEPWSWGVQHPTITGPSVEWVINEAFARFDGTPNRNLLPPRTETIPSTTHPERRSAASTSRVARKGTGWTWTHRSSATAATTSGRARTASI